MERLMIFIDSNNFELAVADLYGGKRQSVDYEALTSYLAGKLNGSLQRFYYYIAQGNPKDDQTKFDSNQRFIDTMKNKRRCIVRVGRLEQRGLDAQGHKIYVEKGIDVYIAIDLLTLAFHNAYDNAVILSADTDYIPVVEQLRQMGKNVTLCLPDKQTGGRMKSASDEFISLSKKELDGLLRAPVKKEVAKR